MKDFKVAFLADHTHIAQQSLAELEEKFSRVHPDEAEVIVALGGDGFMLQTLHENMPQGTPVYGMNCGTVGFLMNDFRIENLQERLKKAEKVELHPLEMIVKTVEGEEYKARAINEVSPMLCGLKS